MQDKTVTTEEIEKEIIAFSIPHSFYGLQFGARMTAVALKNKEVILYSPIPITTAIEERIANLGTVKYIIAPNLFHHLYAGDARSAFSRSKLYSPPGLVKKRKDLSIDHVIGEAQLPWSAELETITIEGTDILQETVLYHKKSKTPICCDLMQNLQQVRGTFTHIYTRFLGDIYEKPGLSRLLRFAFRDKARARDSIDRILALEIEKVVMAHGEVVHGNGREVLQDVYAWLKA